MDKNELQSYKQHGCTNISGVILVSGAWKTSGILRETGEFILDGLSTYEIARRLSDKHSILLTGSAVAGAVRRDWIREEFKTLFTETQYRLISSRFPVEQEGEGFAKNSAAHEDGVHWSLRNPSYPSGAQFDVRTGPICTNCQERRKTGRHYCDVCRGLLGERPSSKKKADPLVDVHQYA